MITVSTTDYFRGGLDIRIPDRGRRQPNRLRCRPPARRRTVPPTEVDSEPSGNGQSRRLNGGWLLVDPNRTLGASFGRPGQAADAPPATRSPSRSENASRSPASTRGSSQSGAGTHTPAAAPNRQDPTQNRQEPSRRREGRAAIRFSPKGSVGGKGGVPVQEADRLRLSTAVGTAQDPKSWHDREFLYARTAAGLRPTFRLHDLRHHGVSELIDPGREHLARLAGRRSRSRRYHTQGLRRLLDRELAEAATESDPLWSVAVDGR